MKLLKTYDWNDGAPSKTPKINYRNRAYYKPHNLKLKRAGTTGYDYELLMPYLDANSTEYS